ncbi:marine proteobacterial sortase target protein [Allohahella marinimesophila]|uniref:Marine proteobacterial sortase target protein n=1 Tax=Allohahella marinimesophila TaxID=1054972 RepID=A0ABP7NNX2_9GAMM
MSRHTKSGRWLDPIRALLAICVWVLISCLAQLTQAAEDAAPATGALMLLRSDGVQVPAPLLDTSVQVHVTGSIARVVIEQRFFNRNSDFTEGTWLFPLADKAAVRAMRIEIGDRVIEGRIAEREAAKARYATAKREGRVASLVEQQRPNLFSTRVANIPPAESVMVRLEYIETIEIDAGKATLRIPTTLTPRYFPATADAQDMAIASSPVVDKSALPIEAVPTVQFSGNFSGAYIGDLESVHHDIVESGDRRGEPSVSKGIKVRSISFSKTSEPMDRDILLTWSMEAEDEPYAEVFGETVEGKHYGLLVLAPQSAAVVAAQVASPIAREIIFVIDTSGSMGGESIRQARAGLQQGLTRLRPDDTFNIIEFNSTFTQLYSASEPATTRNINQALEFVSHLEANGGTEMASALRSAFSGEADKERMRQVVFITDGAVGNEAELFGIIHKLLGGSRLFTVGIGSAPNAWFMRKAAEAGRGSFTYISQTDQVTESMGRLFLKLEAPVLTDIVIESEDGAAISFEPEKVPDLYAGDPVVVAMTLDKPTSLRLRGQLAGKPWSRTVSLDDKVQHPGVSSVWAKARIEALSRRIDTGTPEAELRPAILELALDHHLASRYTSFIAEEQAPVRAPGQPLGEGTVANLLPAGSEAAARHEVAMPQYAVHYPNTATPADLLRLLGLVGLLLCLFMIVCELRLSAQGHPVGVRP